MRIDALKAKLAEYDGVLPLPVIRNFKTVDPTDANTQKVVQLETAMGAAISLFDGAICVQVDRMRFLPVKTTNDLFIMRSDRFHLTDSYEMEDGNYIFPNVDLDPRYYKNINDFNERFPYSVPSLAAANSVTVRGATGRSDRTSSCSPTPRWRTRDAPVTCRTASMWDRRASSPMFGRSDTSSDKKTTVFL